PTGQRVVLRGGDGVGCRGACVHVGPRSRGADGPRGPYHNRRPKGRGTPPPGRGAVRGRRTAFARAARIPRSRAKPRDLPGPGIAGYSAHGSHQYASFTLVCYLLRNRTPIVRMITFGYPSTLHSALSVLGSPLPHRPLPHAALPNQEVVDLVRHSCSEVPEGSTLLAGSFYRNLFKMAPELREMFADD